MFKKKTSQVKAVEIKPITFSQFVDVIFLASPYIKLIKRIKTEYNSNSDGNLFRFVVSSLLNEMDRNDINKIFAILLQKTEQEMAELELIKFVGYIPTIINVNNLLELYSIAKYFGIIE